MSGNKEDNGTQYPIDDLEDQMSFEDPSVLSEQGDVSQYQSVEIFEDEESEMSLADPTGGVVDGEGNLLSSEAAEKARNKALIEANRARLASGRAQRAAKKGILKQTEQSYLIQNAASIIKRSPPGWADENTIGGYPTAENMEKLTIVNSPGNLINTLYTSQKLLPLMGITPRDLSSLTPYIRFWKKENDSLEELKFSSASPNMEEYFNSGIGKQKNVGLKSFSFQSNGDNLFNAKRSFTADMTITFSSLVDLEPVNTGVSWMDLVLPGIEKRGVGTDCSQRSKEVSPPSKKTALIYVELGYKFSDNSIESAELKTAIEESRVFMSLFPNQTEFDFKDDGSIDLKISFTASAEFFADLPSSNVLAIGAEDQAEEIKKTKEAIKKTKDGITEATGKQKSNLKDQLGKQEKELEKKIKRQRATNYSKFLKHLVDKRRLFTFSVSENDYLSGRLPRAFDTTSTAVTAEEAQKIAEELTKKGKNKTKKSINLEQSPTPVGKRTISYFFLGDLINYMAQAINVEGDSRLAEVVVGDYEFYQFPPSTVIRKKGNKPKAKELSLEELIAGTKRVRVNMSQLPISLDMYNLFIYKNVMKRGATTFTFEKFIKKLANELVDNALDGYLKGRVDEDSRKKFSENRASIRTAMLSGYSSDLKPGKEIEIPEGQSSENYRIVPPRITDGSLGEQKPSSFFIIYGSRVPERIEGGDSEQENSKSGVYHLSPGADRGIVKNVKFKQMENRLRDDRILKSRQEGGTDLGVLKLPYNATVEIYGTSPFYPGMVLYISPSLVGVGSLSARRSIAQKLGLGGYYLAHKISTELSMGSLKSTVECNFQSFPSVCEEKQTLFQFQIAEVEDLTHKPEANGEGDISTSITP